MKSFVQLEKYHSNGKNLKPRSTETTNAALVVGKKTRTDLVPALGQAWTAAEPFVRRGDCGGRLDGRRRGLCD